MWLRRIGSFVLAVAVTYLLAVISASQHVAASLEGMGAEVGFGTRLEMIVHDLGGMATSFLPMLVIGFVIAFGVAALLLKWLPRYRYLLYTLAGAVAMATIHLALHAAFDITPVAVARSTGGLLVQALCGAVGGYLYARTTG
ncbi:hypothetical protein [Lentisalinibacter salinarum]|uniref:hypothetical protein n=1 Tax=Lentisalinibacter salinarum TaxID=2992239 RepID=UPI00386EDBD1